MAKSKEKFADTEQFAHRMTVLHQNPKRYKDIRFTKYFGGVCICYWDAGLHEYVVERIVATSLDKEECDYDSESD